MVANVNTIRRLRPFTKEEQDNMAWWDRAKGHDHCAMTVADAEERILNIQTEAGPTFNDDPEVHRQIDAVQEEIDEMLGYIGYKIEDWRSDIDLGDY